VGFLFIAIIAGLAIFAFLQKRKDTRLVAAEKHKSDLVLAALLPYDLFEKVKRLRNSDEQVRHSVFFVDIKTDSKELTHTFENSFHKVLEKHNIRPVSNRDGLYIGISNNGVAEKHMAQNAVRAGIELVEIIRQVNAEKPGSKPAEIGVGIHTGLVVADVLGLKTSEHNIWGDTVNAAARIEQHGMPGKVNISSETYELVKDDFKCVQFGNIPITNQLELGMYFIELS
jgi:class 3 adenylate cyclase